MLPITLKNLPRHYSILPIAVKNIVSNEFNMSPPDFKSNLEDITEQLIRDDYITDKSTLTKGAFAKDDEKADIIVSSYKSAGNKSIDQGILASDAKMVSSAAGAVIGNTSLNLDPKGIETSLKRAQKENPFDTSFIDGSPRISQAETEHDPTNRYANYIFPDVVVLLKNPERTTIIDFACDIANVNVSLTTSGTPGTFSVDLINPGEIHVDDYGYYDIHPGDVIKIFATRKFNKGKRYKQIFWGIVETIHDSYSGGKSSLQITGKDILAWFQYTRSKYNPSLVDRKLIPQIDLSAYNNRYAGKSVPEILMNIIFNDWQAFHMVSGYFIGNIASTTDTAIEELETQQAIINSVQSEKDKAKTQKEKDALQKEIDCLKERKSSLENRKNKGATDRSKMMQDIFKAEQDSKLDVINYWKKLFADELVLKIFGWNGYIKQVNSGNASQIISDENNKPPLEQKTLQQHTQVDASGNPVPNREANIADKDAECMSLEASKFIPMGISSNGKIDFWEGDDLTKLDIIHRVTEATCWEFFQDVDGTLVYKPPFYNEYPANNDSERYNVTCKERGKKQKKEQDYEYILNDEDVLQLDVSEDSSQLFTRQTVHFDISTLFEVSHELAVAFAQDNELIKKFGTRDASPKKQRMITNAPDACAFAKALLDKVNSKYLSATVTIVGRPEIHLGRTVFLPCRNTVYYVIGLSHSFSAGSTYTTTLTLTAGRRMLVDKNRKPLPNMLDGQLQNASRIDALKKLIEKLKQTSDIVDQEIPEQIKGLIENSGKSQEAYAEAIAAINKLEESAKNEKNDKAQCQMQNKAQSARDALELRQKLDAANKEKSAREQQQKQQQSNTVEQTLAGAGYLPRKITNEYGRIFFGTLPYGEANNANQTDPGKNTSAKPTKK